MFDHTKDAIKVFDGDMAHLEQKDEKGITQSYTNAEYDQIAKKWLPEPHLITEKEKYRLTETNVEKLLKELTPMLKKLMPIVDLIDKYSSKAIDEHRDIIEKYHSAAGEANHWKTKCEEYKNEEKSLELKRQMEELTTNKRKPGRPKKEVREIEIEE